MAVKGFNVGGAINKYDFNSLVNKEGAVTAEMLGSDVTTQLTTMSSNISTLQSQVATLNDGYTNLKIEATAICYTGYSVPTTATSYSCAWSGYDLLIICAMQYGNTRGTIVVPVDYFAGTDSGARPMVYDPYVNYGYEVWKNGNNAVYIKAGATDSARGVRIYGVKLAK